MILERVRTALQSRCRLDPALPLLVAVSGGPDSLCLLDILDRLGCKLFIAHFDHQLRSESAAEAEIVRQEAQRRGLPFYLGKEDVASLAHRQKLSLEEAARVARYRFLFSEAQRLGAQAVAVGHNADDQVETVLMHLLRGSGLSGLAGMDFFALPNPWSREIALIRPLLQVWRDEILSYLDERNLHPLEDESNRDLRFYRNRLRHELIPYLESFHRGIKARLWRMADSLRQDMALIHSATQAAWKECICDRGSDFLILDPRALKAQFPSVQRHLLRQAIQSLKPNLRDIDYGVIERAIRLLDSEKQNGQCELIGGLRFFWEGGRLWLADQKASLPEADWPQIEAQDDVNLPVPGYLELANGWRFQAEQMPLTSAIRSRVSANPDRWQAWFDADQLVTPLRVRPRRPGDTIQPLGMEGKSVRVSDLMVNLKVPARARRKWPLVLSGETIAWVAGLRQAHSYRITDLTRNAVHIRLFKRE